MYTPKNVDIYKCINIWMWKSMNVWTYKCIQTPMLLSIGTASHQKVAVCFSGVREGGVLLPDIFAVYTNKCKNE